MRFIVDGGSGNNLSPIALFVPVSILAFLYFQSRKRFRSVLVYALVGIYLVLGTFALNKYGVKLAHGLLMYALVIIVSGVLLPARAAFVMTGCTMSTFAIIAALQIKGISEPYTADLAKIIGWGNLVVLLTLFAIIGCTTWLSSRETEAMLKRVRQSEKRLRAERNLLDARVKERTQELEALQLEKMREMYRFAEFGRLSSGLLHDLANPLTAVSLNLDQLEMTRNSRPMMNVRSGVMHMQKYLQSARKQLRDQGEVKLFNSKDEIEKVVEFLSSRARQHKVRVYRKLAKDVPLYGDSIKFSQVISNLVANAIDAYAGTPIHDKRTVHISSTVQKEDQTLIVTVTDYGVGIKSREIHHIFEPFYSTKSSDRGTGIGLTITKRIVEQDFDGTLTVVSSKASGTVFTVAIRYAILPNN